MVVSQPKPQFHRFENIPKYSDHVVNTERVANADKAMYHVEGGKRGEFYDIGREI